MGSAVHAHLLLRRDVVKLRHRRGRVRSVAVRVDPFDKQRLETGVSLQRLKGLKPKPGALQAMGIQLVARFSLHRLKG
jgi:hypothetical protein